jgi:serine/threonine protein kinase
MDTRVGELKVLHNIPASSNVISYYGWHRLSSPSFRFVVLYMELCPGTLSDFIASSYYINLTPEQKRVGNWDIVRQIAAGLKTCHDTNLMHRDLKINNSIPPTNPLKMLIFSPLCWPAFRP